MIIVAAAVVQRSSLEGEGEDRRVEHRYEGPRCEDTLPAGSVVTSELSHLSRISETFPKIRRFQKTYPVLLTTSSSNAPKTSSMRTRYCMILEQLSVAAVRNSSRWGPKSFLGMSSLSVLG